MGDKFSDTMKLLSNKYYENLDKYILMLQGD